ncbi:MAG: uroporphyrinogen-III synthase, partial [Planctomycetota bacterium]
SYAGIPVTHRRFASAVALVTGHEEPGKTQSALDWDALARFPGTLVIYMGVTTVDHWASALIDAGKPSETPIAIIRRVSHSDQQLVRCTLGDVIQRLTPASKIRPPVIVIIGPVARLAKDIDWSLQGAAVGRPLFAQSILSTRPMTIHRREDGSPVASDDSEFETRLRELGGDVLRCPAIEIEAVESPNDLDDAIRDAIRDATTDQPAFDWIVFSSRHGVRYWMERMQALNLDVRRLAGVRISAVGNRTRGALMTYGVIPDLIPAPESQSAAGLVQQFKRHDAVAKGRFLLVRASRGEDHLQSGLLDAGAVVGDVRSVVAYQHRDAPKPPEHIQEQVRRGTVNWITLTSRKTAVWVAHHFAESVRASPGKTQFVCISQAVADVALAEGLTNVRIAATPSTEAMID